MYPKILNNTIMQIATNAISASREQRVADKAKFMLQKSYKKDLINNLIAENNL